MEKTTKILEMPKENKLYDAWMQEYQERKKYDRETAARIEREGTLKIIVYGFLLAGAAFVVGFTVYWIVRLGT